MTPTHLRHGSPARRPRRLAVPAAVLAAAVLASAGCSAFFDAPDVRIADVRVTGIGLQGATADVVLDVTNPNGFELRAEGLRYRLEFEDTAARDPDAADDEDGPWRLVAEGETDQRLTVPADDRATLTVRVPFEYADLGRAGLSLIREGSLRYRLTGDVRFDAPLTDVRVPFDDTGRVGL